MWMQGSGWLCDSGALESMMNSAGLAGQSAHDPDFGSNDVSSSISNSVVIAIILGLIMVFIIFFPLRMYYKSAKGGIGASLLHSQDRNTSTNTVLTEKDHFHDIFEATTTLKAKYYTFGIHLGLPPNELDAIREQFPKNVSEALSQVLRLWLQQRHNVEKYGLPTWQALVKAVKWENAALANTIGAKYLCTEPGNNALTESDVKDEVQQEKQKSEKFVIVTDVKHKTNEQQDEQKCETMVTDATGMNYESHEQQDEMKRKSPSQLEKDRSEKQKRIDDMFMNLRTAETIEVGVCFMIDRTVYTGPWINTIKDVQYLSERLRANHPLLELHLAFVLYTDYDQPPYTLDFTTDLEKFYHFIDKLVLPTRTRQDRAEGVFEALDAMLNLSWEKNLIGTKVLIHMADAPCHSMQYHSSITKEGDLKLDGLMNQLAEKWIAYHFGCIYKSRTLAMIEAFNSSLLAQSQKQLSIQLFEASQESDLVETIFHSVTTSIGAMLEGLLFDSDTVRYLHEYTIDESIPHWDSLPVQQVMVMPPLTLSALEHPKIPISSKTPMSVKVAPQPFAVGAQRIAYHALDVDHNCYLVIKRSKWADKRSSCLKRCLEAANVHAIAAQSFLRFKKEILAQNSIVKMDLEQVTLGTVGVMQWIANEQEHNFTFEAYVGGSNYTKFNSSFACIPESRDYELNIICQAFSHYTWIRSGKQLLVCDLQGKRDGSRVILTDPVIHNSVSVLHHGSTNLGEKGIKQFFRLHKCNDICRAMQLERPAE